MMRVIALFMLVVFAFSSSVFPLCSSGWEIIDNGRVVCQKIEESKGGYYRYEERFSFQGGIEGKPMENKYEIFRGYAKARAGMGSSACGINVFANYLYGIKTNIKALKEFILDWKSSAPALLLFGLATYLPVAKEVLMGIEMMSNAVAQLRGFSCQRAMEMIKQMNMTDSVLVQNCVKNKLGVTDDADYERMKALDPDKWFDAYKSCLKQPNLFEVITPEMKKWFADKLNYKKNFYCALFGDKKYSEVIANLGTAWSEGGMKERAKILVFAMMPSFEFSASAGGDKIGEVKIGAWEVDGERQAVKDLIDNMLRKELPSDIMEIIDETLNAYATCFGSGFGDCDSAMSSLESKLDTFKKKWNVDLEPILKEIDFIARLEGLLLARREKGDPKAGSALAELLMSLQKTYIPRIQKQVYLEVRKQIIEQYNSLIAYARQQKAMGTTAGCPSEDEDDGES